MMSDPRDVILANALRRALGRCKNCGAPPNHLQIHFEDYALVAACISCGRNNLPSKADTTVEAVA